MVYLFKLELLLFILGLQKNLIGEHHQVRRMHVWIREFFCQPKAQVFFSLVGVVIKDRLSTQERFEKGIWWILLNEYFVDGRVKEIVEHLFFS